MRRISIVAVLCLIASGCTGVTIGEPYDKAIDEGLNDFQKSSAAFIKSMQMNAATAKGSYDSDEAKEYYSASAATLSNLQLRADMLSSRTCPTQKVLQLLGSMGVETSETTIADAESRIGGNDAASPPLDVSGNCIAIMVRGVRMAEDNLESDHKELGKLTAGVADLNSLSIDASVRMTLTALRAKNY